MSMTEKTKKYLAIGGGTIICAGLVAAISLQFRKTPAGEETLPEESSTVAEIIVDLSKASDDIGTEEIELVIQPNTEETTESSSTPVDTRPAQTDQTEQSIQPEVTKPAEPNEAVLTDPTTRPDGTKVDTPPRPVEHEAVVIPTESASAPNQPQGGDVQDGKTYLPGFGYIEDSGPNQGGTAGDMYENGNKIGSMD